MPVYDSAAAAEALDITSKQLDNIVSRHSLSGVERHRRGVGRRISADAVMVVGVAAELARATRMPIEVALDLARTTVGTSGEVKIGRFATLTVDVDAIRAFVAARLNSAVEMVGRRQRGRRPSNQAR